jgi:hypothetical protein
VLTQCISSTLQFPNYLRSFLLELIWLLQEIRIPSVPLAANVTQSAYQRATSWTACVRFTAEAKDFSPLHSVQTGSGDHPSSNIMVSGGLLPPKVKLPSCEADQSPPSSAEDKNGGAMPPHPYIFMSWSLMGRGLCSEVPGPTWRCFHGLFCDAVRK